MNAKNIEHACVEIAYDNGMVNRFTTESSVLEMMLDSIRARFTTEEIELVELELSNLSDKEFKEACTGYVETFSLTPLTDKLLNVAFGE